MSAWTVDPINASVARLLDSRGLHVGNLKLINGLWKFKAIGYDVDGSVIPGGGPMTDQHNTVLARLDASSVSVLAPVGDASEGSSPQERLSS